MSSFLLLRLSESPAGQKVLTVVLQKLCISDLYFCLIWKESQLCSRWTICFLKQIRSFSHRSAWDRAETEPRLSQIIGLCSHWTWPTTSSRHQILLSPRAKVFSVSTVNQKTMVILLLLFLLRINHIWRTCLVVEAVNVVYLDFSKIFDAVFHSSLLEKLAAQGMDRGTVGWVKNWLNGHAQGHRGWGSVWRVAGHQCHSPGLSPRASFV